MDRELTARQLATAYAVLGCVGLGLGIYHAWIDPHFGGILEAVLVWGVSSLVFYSITCIRRHALSNVGHFRALLITLGGTLAITLIGASLGVVWLVHGVSNVQWVSLVSLAFAVGAAMSSRASLYIIGLRETIDDYSELVTLLTINQRVLRHNHRNKLNVALGHLDELEAETSPAGREHLEIARTHLDELLSTTEMAKSIISVWERDVTEPFNCHAVIQAQAETIRAAFDEVQLEIAMPSDLVVEAHPAFPNAVFEILENAVEHNDPGVSITIAGERRAAADEVVLSFIDTGCGIPKLERTVLSETVETDLAHSQGLGLWYLYWVVKQSDGRIDIRENQPTGTVIELGLPASTETNR